MGVAVTNINGNHPDEDESNNIHTGNFIISEMAQEPTMVNDEPSFKNVVLEEFTGVNCTYCAAGHKIANQIMADNPGRVAVINIHQGSFANAVPDYRTRWGDAVAGQTGLDSYPAGTVNRHLFSGGNTALERDHFPDASEQILHPCVRMALTDG